MANGITYKLEGVKEITEILNGLPHKVRDQVLRSFNRKAASKKVIRPLRQVLPYSKKTKMGFKVQSVRDDKTAIVAGPTSDVFWVRFVEGGTVARYTKSGAYRGQLNPGRRVEPFVNSQVPSIIDFVNKEYGEEINKFVLKKIKRLKK